MRIYRIVNVSNGHCYVGSETKHGSRWRNHLYRLRNKKHHSVILQRAFNKYGDNSFRFEIIEEVEGDNAALLTREQHYIDTLNPEYNCCRIAGNTSGIKRTDEHRAKISLSLKKAIAEGRRLKPPGMAGRHHSEETKAKIRASSILRGPVSEITRQKISFARKGMKASPKAIEANRQAQLGKKHTQEAIDKMIAFQSTRTHRPSPSEETRRKMSEAHKHRWALLKVNGWSGFSESAKENIRMGCKKRPPVSAETRAKLSARRIGNKINLGRKMPEDVKIKISESLKKNFRERCEHTRVPA
jgi:group I intron endonuclease